MAASFVSASSQKLLNSAPALAGVQFVPATVALWVRPTSAGAQKTFWSFCDTASTLHFHSLCQTVADTYALRQTDDASPLVTSAGTVVSGQWAFLVGRFISTTNRRLAVLDHTGLASHNQGVTSDNPAGLDVMAFGCLNHSTPAEFFDGQIAEFWYTKTDIQPDGAQLQNSTLRQLAHRGPFSLPHIAKDIIEYRSFWSCLGSDRDRAEEVYLGAGKTRQTWVNTNGVTLGPHVPRLYPDYVRPRDAKSLMVV